MIETVEEHCKHEDCIYRQHIGRSFQTPVCMYAATEHQSRGCKISECTRYKAGTKTKARMTVGYEIKWEYELDGNADIGREAD